MDFEGCDIRHLNVHGADGRSKRTLHCSDYFRCVGSDFLGSVDSGFWLVAVTTVGFWISLGFLQLEFSIVLKKIINVFSRGVSGNL